ELNLPAVETAPFSLKAPPLVNKPRSAAGVSPSNRQQRPARRPGTATSETPRHSDQRDAQTQRPARPATTASETPNNDHQRDAQQQRPARLAPTTSETPSNNDHRYQQHRLPAPATLNCPQVTI
ncbi:hypothetical protein F441_14070, partial [Phytophthora nicotianae CJ01A1]